MNILVTRDCKNSCPYCFANAEMTRRSTEPKSVAGSSITIESVQTLANWLCGDQPRQINIIGGEPFLLSYLPKILTILRQACPQSELTIFTGGVADPRVLSDLPSNTVSGIVINSNERRDYVDHQAFAAVEQFTDTAIANGFRVSLGFNVWRLDFDTDFIPNLAYSLGRNGYRWSVANPCMYSATRLVNPSEFSRLSKSVIRMLRRSTELGLSANLDCPLPLCFFDNADLQWVARYHPSIVANLGRCSAPIDVTPELEAIRCLGLSELCRVSVANHHNFTALAKWFEVEVDLEILSRNGIFEQCRLCEHFVDGRCQGGCMGWRDMRKPNMTSTPHNLHEDLLAGKYIQVIQEVRQSSKWHLTPLKLYLGALAAQRLGESDTALHFTYSALENVTNLQLKKRLLVLLQHLRP